MIFDIMARLTASEGIQKEEQIHSDSDSDFDSDDDEPHHQHHNTTMSLAVGDNAAVLGDPAVSGLDAEVEKALLLGKAMPTSLQLLIVKSSPRH